ncbi:MAG: hypothetical protein LIP03_12280 [Bacteroidales bacterium]|nr:hypothetical protein [Bacteroidales bacterium]
MKDQDHLWSVVSEDSDFDEFSLLFEKWNNFEYLFEFFSKNRNREDLKAYFGIEIIQDAIEDTFEDAQTLEALILDLPYTEELDSLFKPLGVSDRYALSLSREKARNWNRHDHPSWLRVYAIRLEENAYIITGGAIKLTASMQEREHTNLELAKLNQCLAYLKANNVFDKDSFMEFEELGS